MKDDGTGGDAIAGDGVFSATIPGQSCEHHRCILYCGHRHQGRLDPLPVPAE